MRGKLLVASIVDCQSQTVECRVGAARSCKCDSIPSWRLGPPSVMASNQDTEGGAPVSLIEAQATGLPVVSTFHADIPEVVLNEQTGFLVPERDVEKLAQATITLAQSPQLLMEFGKNGREHVVINHNAIRQGEKLAEIYSEAASM